MFEGLMANLVVPETTWGPHSFGLNDRRWAQVQARYVHDALHFPVFGISPSSTADDTGNYGGFGVEGQVLAPDQGLAVCTTCATETTVSPHASAIRYRSPRSWPTPTSRRCERITRACTPPIAASLTQSIRSPDRSDTGASCSISP
jgi:hypothetical protein